MIPIAPPRPHTRRTLLTLAAGAALAGGWGPRATAATPPDEDYQDFFSPDLPDLVSQGTDPALAPEIKKAGELLSGAPSSGAPLDVMLYLERLTDRNADDELYNAGWRTRWNPVIVTFFTATHTRPSGDITPWCAASVNWCLGRCGFVGTGSAMSGRFRDAPGLTDSPRPGDIAVFSDADETNARLGHGHVTLFLEETNDRVFVVGGNQKNSFGHHGVCRKWIPKRGAALTFHSYHSVAAMKR
jgi:uncharacterized protein (TIGR02594 family)